LGKSKKGQTESYTLWKADTYGCHILNLESLTFIEIRQIYDSETNVQVWQYRFGPYLDKGFSTLEKAKAAAVEAVRVKINQSLIILDAAKKE